MLEILCWLIPLYQHVQKGEKRGKINLDIKSFWYILINIHKIRSQENLIMARIKIGDLPKDRKISKELMRKIAGGIEWSPDSPYLPIGGAVTDKSKKLKIYKFK